jgi:exodeoxyribonuclease VII small subunit
MVSKDKGLRDVSEMSFREASTELERIVRQLEGGDLELEVALDNYARGVELLRSLRERLNDAEQKVRVLLDASQEVIAPDTTSAPSKAFIDE